TKLESVGKGLKETADRVDADGKVVHWEWTAQYDGKDYPVNGDPDRDAVSLKRIDDNTIEVTSKKNGKPTTLNRIVVSPDGKVRANTVTGTNSKGQTVNNLLVFDRT